MTDSDKFYSDIQRALKKHSSVDDETKIFNYIEVLFIKSSFISKEFILPFFDYWQNKYIKSLSISELTEQNINKLVAFFDFLNGNNDYADFISQEDWEEIGAIINSEAENLPIEDLQKFMGILLEKGVLN